MRHGMEPQPRFGAPETPNWPFGARHGARNPSAPVTPRTETRWRPGTRERVDTTRRPQSRSLSGLDRPAPAPPAAAPPAPATVPPVPPVPRWKPETRFEPARPSDRRVTSFAPALTEPEAAPLPPTPTPPQVEPEPPQVEPAPPQVEPAPLPPSARRRPSAVRPPSDLREAVAGAVARAAAQGPLLPRGPGESGAVTPQASEPSALWPDNGPATPLPVEASSALVAPVEIAVHEQPTTVAEVPANAWPDPPGPYEELPRLAGQRTSAGASPRRHNSRVSTRPAAGFPPGAAAPCDPHSAQPGPAGLESAPSDSTSLDVATSATGDQELGVPELSSDKVPSWPVGERRSAARQARSPLPAALQAAVASEVAQADAGESASQPIASGQPPEHTDPMQTATHMGTGTFDEPATARGPGIIRRYGSAIAIVVLFIAAGGAAAGIAAFHGPVNRPRPPTPAQDRARADSVVLRASNFPRPWHVSNAGGVGASYGVGSALVTPAIVRSWLASHPACTTDLNSVSAAMMPSAGGATAVASTQATAVGPPGRSWQIADTVAFHSSPAQASTDLTAVRSLIREPRARACIVHFWAAALLAELPTGSQVAMTVWQPRLPALARNPIAWAMSMSGTATTRHIAIPIHFEVTSFTAGRARVSLAASSKLAPLPANLYGALLVTLATRAEQHAP